MSALLDALEGLATNNTTAWFRLSAISQAVLFYATPYLTTRNNWIDRTIPTDTVSDSDWDTIENYVDTLLFEAKNPMIGMILPFMTDELPPNVLLCDGSIYNREDYPLLVAVLNMDDWGADEDTFFVPDLRGTTIIGTGTNFDIDFVFDNRIGNATHTITMEEMPNHTHGSSGHEHGIPLTTSAVAVAPGELPVVVPLFPTGGSTETGYDPNQPEGGFAGATNGQASAWSMYQPSLPLRYGVIAS